MPDWRAEIRAEIARLRLDPHREAEIVEELGGDLEDRYRELIARGERESFAAAAIRKEHLSPDRLAEAFATVERPAPPAVAALGESGRGGRWSSGLADLRFALRSLRKNPGLTLVAILTLTLGIGGNAAIFSVVNAVLVRPLPFKEPSRLVSFWGTAPDKGLPVVNYPDGLYSYYRSRARTIESMAVFTAQGLTMSQQGAAFRVDGASVTSEFFDILGAAPLEGRLFTRDEALDGKNNVAILSWALWQERFGGKRVIGETVLLDHESRTIVGVMPRGFDFPNRSRVWLPLGINPSSINCWCYDAIGRLRPGQTRAILAREIDALNDDFWADRENRPRPVRKAGDPPHTIVVALSDQLTGEVRTPALILLGAVAMVLLIACANLANLLLARATERSREIAVRSALGASPARIRRQLMTESALLSVAGAVLGLGLAAGALGPIGRFALERVAHLDAVRLDPVVLGFTVLVTGVTTLLFGLVPAFRATRLGTAAALRDGTRGTTDRMGRRLNDGFTVAQIALALVLLVGAGLLMRSYAKLVAIDPGFDADRVAVGRLALPWTVYRERRDARLVFERILDRVKQLPGVEAAGFTTTAPFGAGNSQQEVLVEGREPVGTEPIPVISGRVVTPGYFAAVRTPLLAGRYLAETDRDSSERVLVVDESLARRYWPDARTALGHRVHIGSAQGEKQWWTIVGVVASIRHRDLGKPPDHYGYIPMAQTGSWSMDLVVRGSGSAEATAASLRAAMATIEPGQPFYDVHTLASAVDRSLSTRRFTDLLLLGFASVALFLAAIGVYGVISRSVAARIREFGVRLALGATPGRIRTDVLRHGARLVAIGTGLGALGAALLTSALGSLLFDVARFDPVSFIVPALALALVALVACFLPAVRATRADPVTAMRDT